MLSGAIVPHAPILAVGANSDGIPAAIHTIAAALEHIRSIDCDVVVLVSPHGAADAVYREPRGSLDGFGVPDMSASATRSELSSPLAAAWGVPETDGDDHGVVVPLLLDALPPVPLVACAVKDWTDPGDRTGPVGAMESAARLGDAIASLPDDLSVLVVASAHTSAALSRRAPLTERDAGARLDERILGCLRDDPGGLLEIEAQAWTAGGACGAGPLALFGRLFAGRDPEVLAYEAPVGVGYLVARVP